MPLCAYALVCVLQKHDPAGTASTVRIPALMVSSKDASWIRQTLASSDSFEVSLYSTLAAQAIVTACEAAHAHNCCIVAQLLPGTHRRSTTRASPPHALLVAGPQASHIVAG